MIKPSYEELEQRVRELERAQTEGKKNTQTALGESEELYRNLIDFSPLPFLVTQGEKIVFANAAAAKLFGTGHQDELVGSSPQDWIHPDFVDQAYQRRRRIINTGESVEPVELILLRQDKKEAVVLANATRIIHNGSPALLSVFHDITARKRAEEALRESEKKYRDLIEGLNDTIYRMTLPEGRYEYFSPSVKEVFGYYSEEFINNPLLIHKIIHPDSAGYFKEKWKELLEGKVQETYEYKIIDSEGNERWIVQSNKAIFDDSGKIKAIEGLCRNITERKEAELLLEAERAQLRSLFEYSGEAILLLDLENHILDANSGFERIFGYSPEEARGKMIGGLICPDRFYHTESKELDEQSLNGIKDAEIIRKRKDGEEIDVRVSAGPIKLGDRITGRFVIFDDITERKKAEEALNDERSFLSAVLDNIEEAVVTCDREGRLLRFNEAARRLHGLPEQPIPPDQWADYYDLYRMDGTTPLPTEKIPLFRALTGERVQNAEIVVAPTQAGARSMVCSGQALTSDAGEIVGAVVAMHDITERKQAEESLRQSEARYRDIFENVSDFIYFHDMEGNFTETNLAFKGVYVYQDKEMESINVRDMMPKENIHQFDEYLKRIKKYGSDEGYFRFIDRNSKSVIVEYKNSLVFDSEGKPIGVRGSARDITDKLRAENERKKLEDKLRQAHKMEAIGTLAGGIAHDFNNILSIIIGNTELATLDVPEWSPAQENLKEVRDATLRARELVKQILLFARQKEHTVSNTHLEPIAKESLKMLRASIPTTVEIRENIEKGLPPVLADPSQIQQIIMNLCTNAGQIMEAEGGILTFTLATTNRETPLHTMVEELPPGRYVRMQVKDTGPGIPPENLEKIFDPFFTTKGVGEGTGLGLAVVHGIVQDRNGGIVVESEEGLGTTFSIYLPPSEIESVEVKAKQKMDPPRGTERVLFVDDEPMIMKLGQRMLERLGYEVETKASGTDALECFRQDPHRFDLVVTDMSMPGIRGDRLAEEILAILPDIPVILSTGYSRQISKEKAHEMGIRAFVMKPLTQHELAKTVRRVLDEKPQK